MTVPVAQTAPAACEEGQKAVPVNVTVTVAAAGQAGPGAGAFDVEVELRCRGEFGRGLHPSYRFTFADFDGSLQYASAIPPARECASDGAAGREEPGEGCPLLLSTHGASVDAASPFWTDVYQQQERAWTLLPTNRGGFGYDWQGAGLRNAQAAWAALARDLPGVPEAAKASYGLSGAVLYSGHSMGGHGCLILATHFPEGELASACTAGWIKAALYPPEFLSPAASLGDVHLNAVLRAATGEYDTDFALPNLRGLPMLVRMGAEDEDVPMLNLLRIARLKAQLERNGTAGAAVQVSEVPGKPVSACGRARRGGGAED